MKNMNMSRLLMANENTPHPTSNDETDTDSILCVILNVCLLQFDYDNNPICKSKWNFSGNRRISNETIFHEISALVFSHKEVIERRKQLHCEHEMLWRCFVYFSAIIPIFQDEKKCIERGKVLLFTLKSLLMRKTVNLKEFALPTANSS